MTPICLRSYFDASGLRRAARASTDANQVRRLLALAAIYNGTSRAQAARTSGVTPQIVRDWVVRFNAEGSAGLIDRKAPGRAPLLGPVERAAVLEAIEAGPLPAIDGVVRWRLVDLSQWLWERFAVSVSRQTLERELQAMEYRKLSARPLHHAQANGAAFKSVPTNVGNQASHHC